MYKNKTIIIFANGTTREHLDDYNITITMPLDIVGIKVGNKVRKILCTNNRLKDLTLPPSVTMLICDKEVKGLDKYIDTVKITLF